MKFNIRKIGRILDFEDLKFKSKVIEKFRQIFTKIVKIRQIFRNITSEKLVEF